MYRAISLTLGLVGSLSISASVPAMAQSITTDVAPGVNFSAYHTYGWVDSAPPSGMNPITYQRIIANIDSAMASKGYRQGEPADLALVLTLGAEQRTEVQSWGRFGLRTDVWQYTQGQLTLDVYDYRTKQALWHGQASKTVNPDKPNPAKVDKAVAKLMAKFPATAAASGQPAQ